MLDTLIRFIPFLLLLGIVVTIHELGHFLTAKKFGVYCGEFSIGMGPLLLKKKVGETQYSLRLLPIGGFVSMAGEADDTKKDEAIPFERTINGISPWKRIIVMLAGIFMNVMLALVVFIGVSVAQGEKVDTSVPSDPVIGMVSENSAAEDAGLKADDKIVSITTKAGETYNIKTADDITKITSTSSNPVTLKIERNGKMKDVELSPRYNEDTDTYLMGVNFYAKTIKLNFVESVAQGVANMGAASTALFAALGRMLSGQDLDKLSGPIGIYQVAAKSVDYGAIYFFNLLAIFSINLGVMNALPIPILDGGRALITLLETIFKRKFNEKVINTLMYVGAAALVGLMVFASVNDILGIL